jgi:hypothetical protein
VLSCGPQLRGGVHVSHSYGEHLNHGRVTPDYPNEVQAVATPDSVVAVIVAATVSIPANVFTKGLDVCAGLICSHMTFRFNGRGADRKTGLARQVAVKRKPGTASADQIGTVPSQDGTAA